MGSPASTIQVDHSSTPVPGDNRILSNQHTPSTSDRTPLKKGLKNLRPTSPRRRPHMYVFLLLNFGRDLDPGPNTRGTLAHTRASVRQTLATLSKHLRCSRLNTWPELCYEPRLLVTCSSCFCCTRLDLRPYVTFDAAARRRNAVLRGG